MVNYNLRKEGYGISNFKYSLACKLPVYKNAEIKSGIEVDKDFIGKFFVIVSSSLDFLSGAYLVNEAGILKSFIVKRR